MNKTAFTSIVLVVVFAGVAAGVLYKKSANECPRFFSPVMAAEPYYEGELFDAHLHLPTAVKAVSTVAIRIGIPVPAWDDELSLEYLHCLFGEEGVSRAYGFHVLTRYFPSLEVKKAKEMDKKYPGMITHFLMPTMIGPNINPDVSTVRKVLAENPGFFRGLGELKTYDGKKLDDPYVLSLIDLAREYKLIVMMHPFNEHKAAVEKIVRQYHDVTFLFHGIDYVKEEGEGDIRDNRDWLKNLIANNDNVYYSLEGRLPFYGWLREHKGEAVPKEKLLPYVKSQFDIYLKEDTELFKKMIEAYPDRFLRGTDRMHRPHFDRELSALIVEYSRAFIGRLAPSVQEKYAHENAEKLLGKE
ncbi:MAG: hypothetical protein Greene041679_133 [Parcubacteria group bacterium Greene0416_79]|nr:MAG: hypothetical protein Greene041679_133 [Parcubacteria group bacterium Greene0416_79]